MEVSITQFRRKIFELAGQALGGAELWVTHKGRRFRIVPEGETGSRLSRITRLEVVNPKLIGKAAKPKASSSLQQEMEGAWERDWSTL